MNHFYKLDSSKNVLRSHLIFTNQYIIQNTSYKLNICIIFFSLFGIHSELQLDPDTSKIYVIDFSYYS